VGEIGGRGEDREMGVGSGNPGLLRGRLGKDMKLRIWVSGID
jgi:hypothetical protein